MPGVATPTPITEAFGINAGAGFINTIPETTSTPGAASFDQGFPQVCFLPTTSGGIPPSGADFNGILNMVSAYCAALQAGQLPQYNAAVATAIGGYALGAILAQASGGGFWLNTSAGNTSDPDTGGGNWLSIGGTATGYVTAAPAAGANNDYNAGGSLTATTAILDLTPAGNANITGIAAGTNNQSLLITNLSGSYTLTLNALNAGSLAANRIRLPADMILPQYASIKLKYLTSVNLWVLA
jgi:hypothetical protein